MKKFLVAIVLLTSTSVFAAGGSEAKTTDMYAPKSGASEFVGGILLPFGKIESGAISTTLSGFALGFVYSYGFSDMLAAYVTQGYSNVEYKTDPGGVTSKTSGLGDTKVGIKAVIDYGPSFFYYDVGYQMGLLAKAKTDGSGESTAVSARPRLEVQGGAGTTFDLFGVGALLKYDLYQEGDSDTDIAGLTVTTKNKSGTGTLWKLYAQYQSAFKLGFSYSESTVDSYDAVVSGVTSSIAKSEIKTIALYSIIPINAGSEVHLELQKPELKNTSATQSTYFLGASYRCTF